MPHMKQNKDIKLCSDQCLAEGFVANTPLFISHEVSEGFFALKS